MSWHYLQGQEEASWEEVSLDGAPDALLSLMPTVDESCLEDRKMDTSQGSRSGTTSKPSTVNPGGGASMSSAVGSPARTSPQLAQEGASKENEVDSGWRWQESFAKFDQATSSWKTRQRSLLADLELYSETWPNWGSMQNGESLERTSAVPHISERGFGFWVPTPTAGDAKSSGSRNTETSKANAGISLTDYVRMDGGLGRRVMLPTPTANQYGTRNNGKRGDGTTYKTAGSPRLTTMARRGEWVDMDQQVPGGKLNPAWVEWLMGWPEGWTDLEPLGMDKYQSWLQSHLRC